jgi:phage repressor protein C with HTH and peptisase S24 domain
MSAVADLLKAMNLSRITSTKDNKEDILMHLLILTDHMAPQLTEKSIVSCQELLNPSDKIRTGKVYIFETDGLTIVRRVKKILPGGIIMLSCDNAEMEDNLIFDLRIPGTIWEVCRIVDGPIN